MNANTSIVVHDYFGVRGGGERVALSLAEHLEADLMYGLHTPESFALDLPATRLHDLALPKMFRGRFIQAYAMVYTFLSAAPKLRPYRLRIFSGAYAPFAAPKADSSALNIYYCHTPIRFLFDQEESQRTALPLALRILWPLMTRQLRARYLAAVGRMDVIVANSENIRRRIKKYLGRDSVVVYPPVDTEGFQWGEPRNYYLSTARLTPLKRVRTIVEAFLSMPDRHLVVASGGNQEAELRQLAAGAPNIRFTGWIDDAELKTLVAGAIATIYIPVEEDFGISPVESMAAGKPVIGVAEGGLLETILPEKTGLLLNRDPSSADVKHAVEQLPPERALRMRAACEAQSQLFTRGRFLSGMDEVIAKAKMDKNYA
jgi:glycosyltransferase involved in cell wall biosynthesis